MARAALYPRYIQPRLAEALADTPVVLIHGPRQSGKTTLARTIGEAADFVYFTFDDDVTAAAARGERQAGKGHPDQRTLRQLLAREHLRFTGGRRLSLPAPCPGTWSPGTSGRRHWNGQ